MLYFEMIRKREFERVLKLRPSVCVCVCVRGIKRDREDDEFKFSLSRSSKLSSME